MTLTYGSLFAGIGGFDLALSRAGMVGRWSVELDPMARLVLERHWPEVPHWSDIREVGRRQLGKVDVIAGGFPCQDLSIAGGRAGLAGERSGLFYEMVRIVKQLQPRVLVWENVPGLLSSYTPDGEPPAGDMGIYRWEVEEDSDFEAVLHALAECGYFGAWRVLDAQHFGLAQRRERLFGVFARGRFGHLRAAEILDLAGGGGGDSPPGGVAGKDVAGPLGGVSAGGGTPDNPDRMTFVVKTDRTGGNGSNVGVNPSPTLDLGTPPAVARPILSRMNRQDYETQTLIAAPFVAGFQWNQAGETNLCHTPGMSPPVRTNGGNAAHVAEGVRRLMPVECLRLQGFPDHWLDVKPSLSDTAKYRLTGNAVPVPVAEWIARRVVEALS